MEGHARCAILRPGAGAKRHGEQNLRGCPVATDYAFWRQAALLDRRFEPEQAQDLHRIGAKPDTRADLLELARLLINLGLDAALSERDRGGQSANAGTDDRNTTVSIGAHRLPPPIRGGRRNCNRSPSRPAAHS